MSNQPPQKRTKDLSKHARQRRLGDQLKRLYDDVVQEPIPDEFFKLLEQADEQASSPKDDKSEA
ncbi:NepR family anti-sigma factor [Hirschia litorea]|uniref:NepR family anti-sigma factor n=1 Tax=Hirschia litorea TaxID=1199156 RepID=A0ABW2IP08_9PROT